MISRRNFILAAAAALAAVPALPAAQWHERPWREVSWPIFIEPDPTGVLRIDPSIDEKGMQAMRNVRIAVGHEVEIRNFRRHMHYDSREQYMHVIYTAEVR